ncbi:MAG: hypothetical protein AB7T06_30425 [Kofleriaceae bacterium]
MSNGWRNLSFVLAAACSWQAYRSCTRPAPEVTQAECSEPARASRDDRGERITERPPRDTPARADDTSAGEPAPQLTDGVSLFGVKLPGWARSLMPQAGEDLRSYRDRMIPLAQLALAPHRNRVARSSEDFAKAANLDANQRAELDAAAKETAQAIEDRLFNAVLSGELQPSSFKPMAGVAVARDVLDLVDRGNKRFLSSLRQDQLTSLSNHPFDFGDFLLFSTKWEDAISGL